MSKRPMPPPPAQRASGGDPQLHTQTDNPDAISDRDNRFSEPDNGNSSGLKPNESRVVNVKSADEEESARRRAEEERKRKEEEDEDKPPCCTKKCALMPFLLFGYLLLFIFIVVGLAVSFAFIIVHLVMRLLHFLFWGLSQVRHSVDDVLDIDKLQEQHKKDYEIERQKYEQRIKDREAEKDRKAAERRRQGKKPKKYEEESDEEKPPSEDMRVCSVTCVGKSFGSCLGMSFNGMAYLFFVLAFMFGFASIAIFTAIFSSYTPGGVRYLCEFRRKYDLDFSQKEEASEKK